MIPTIDQLHLISGNRSNVENKNSIIAALEQFGGRTGLDVPHRLAHYLSQTSHESGGYRYDEEIASGAAYEGRADLGNVQVGDGKRYKGRGPIQVTGRSNYQQFTAWCLRTIGPTAPNFEADPDALNTDPWEGLAPIWYWSTRKLNRLADENNIEQITKKINGGLNGFADRVERYVRAGLVLAGFGPDEVEAFQVDARRAGLYDGELDNDPGPKTRAAIHLYLSEMASKVGPVITVKPSPVVTEKVVKVPVEKPVEVPVVPKGADKRGWLFWPAGGIGIGSVVPAFFDLQFEAKVAIAAVIVVLILVMLFLGDRIIRRTKALIAEINA